MTVVLSLVEDFLLLMFHLVAGFIGSWLISLQLRLFMIAIVKILPETSKLKKWVSTVDLCCCLLVFPRLWKHKATL